MQEIYYVYASFYFDKLPLTNQGEEGGDRKIFVYVIPFFHAGIEN